MNPDAIVSLLEPLRNPDAVPFWPPAPGWWVLAFAVVLLAGFAVYRIWQRYQRNAYRRQALRQLAALKEEARETPEFVAALNALLKSTALAAFPRRDIASQHGARWCSFLNDSLEPAQQFDPAFAEAAYRGTTDAIDRERLVQSAECWIRQHRSQGT